ncbi:DEAD/DEAH box helicase [Clostridium sp. OF09-36]|uniref:CRISPR-associated helicase/endonuclease Cas3 n=1 Tax=Clostridium sp. OF09-36 TaxID=2292310 RepID=UPI001FA99CE4|nr:DEAD/DEAH box helicase [Clostridium sp. OF09-36]
MEDYLAHSAKMEYPAQTYLAHIQGVDMRAVQYAKDVEQHAKYLKNELHDIVHDAACLHDLGKLETENQMVLRGHGHDQRHLPINHVDAGSAVLVKNGYGYAALAVYSHHKGLPNMQAESMRETAIFRDEHIKVRQHTDSVLSDLLQCHQSVFLTETCKEEQPYPGEISVFIRMVLSCLADADHTDTAVTYGKAVESELPALRAEERLAALDQYVSKLEGDDERNRLRREMYLVCRNARINSDFSSCDSPVGSGKTTAVMAHLLQQAIKRNARHIFVILPYTSIIQQSVDIYRKALLLPGEDPEAVVAELHSRVDFQNYNTRYLTSLWRAPIVVTTAVAFFETLASNRPSALRWFHELPGSVIFIDKAHNALLLKLLPIAWNWMNVLAEEWNCYWTLASGSLVRYWELKPLSQVGMKHPCVEELVYADLQKRLMMYEKGRIRFCFQEKPVTRKKLIEWIHSAPGPRLLIVNTVQSAAVLADDFLKDLADLMWNTYQLH